MKLSELSSKDVINDADGSRLGRITDLDIDIASGKIATVTINRGFRFMSAFNKDYAQIPWSKILKVGSDVIIIANDYNKKDTKEQKS